MNNYHVKCPHCQIGVIVTERSKLLDELADCLRRLVEESIQSDCSCEICNPAYHNALALLKRIGK